MQDQVAAWVKNVGTVDQTLHWCHDELYAHICTMNGMNDDDFQHQFVFGSSLDHATVGVMEILFAASCFECPIVVDMGKLFWVFCRELIRIRVSDVDQLNFLLWGQVVDQTVLVLDPVDFHLDSMIPAIQSVISIEGSFVTSREGYNHYTTVYMASHSSLIFHGNARVSKLIIKRFEVLGAAKTPFSMIFEGVWGEERKVYIYMLMLHDGGCRVKSYNEVHCDCLMVDDAVVGLHAESIKRIYVQQQGHAQAPQGFHPGFSMCETALTLKFVNHFVCTGCYFKNCFVVWDGRIASVCVVQDVSIMGCVHMGEILMSPGHHPSFVGVTVCFILLFSMNPMVSDT